MQGRFNNQDLLAQNATVNVYTHNYALQLPQLTQKVCGKEFTITSTGYNGTLTHRTKIFVKNCKYDYYVHSICMD